MSMAGIWPAGSRIQLALDNVPAATVNRFCASSVQTARMAFHAIRAGEGHAYVSAGVECVSRYRDFGSAGVDPEESHNPQFAEAKQRTQRIAASNEHGTPRNDGDLHGIYIAMGQTAENVATARYFQSRAGRVRRALSASCREAIANGLIDAEIAQSSRRRHGGDGGRWPAPVRRWRPSPPCRALTLSPRKLLPLNDGAAAVVIMSVRAAELGLRPLARIVATGVGALSQIMGLGPVEASRRRWPMRVSPSATSTWSRSTRRSRCK